MHYNENDFIQIQKSLIKKIVCEDIFNSNNVKTIAGVDLAYWNDSNEQEYAVCCIVVINKVTHAVIEKKLLATKLNVPIFKGFLHSVNCLL